MGEGQGQGPYLVEVAGRQSLYIQDGRKRTSTRTADRAAAHRELQRYIEETRTKQKISGDELATLGECMEHYRSRRQAKLEKNGTWNKKYRYLHARLMDRMGDRVLSDIDYRFGDEYTAARFSEGVGAETVRQELQYVRTAWRMAYKDRRTSVEPAAYDLPATPARREDYFTKEEAEAMIWAARGVKHVWLFLQIGFGTGARPGSVLSLTWDRVDFERGWVDFRPRDEHGRIKPGDTKKYSVTPMNEDLSAALKAAKGRFQTGPVVRYRDRALKKIDVGFANAREAAGIRRHLTPHAMRHSVITWMAQDGVNFFEIAGFVGHTSPSMLEKVYGHHNPARMQGALKSVSLKPGARRL